jgi:hypothetical protein
LGHKRTYAVQNGMSALPPIATAKATFIGAVFNLEHQHIDERHRDRRRRRDS